MEIGLNSYRHTCSHVLAQAVKRLWPDTKLAIGPAIENGFYYDFDSTVIFTPDHLEKIEMEMERIIDENLSIEKVTMQREEALRIMNGNGEMYKLELIADIPPGEEISFYRQGEFIDLCAGPHLRNTGNIKAFKLTHIAGAYWRGNEKNKMLQRIYGTAFESKEQLESHIKGIEDAKKRDHRKLGKELDLFSIDDYVGQGLVLWHPKLSIVREEIELYWRKEHRRRGYEYVYTSNIGLAQLWETSGHLRNFTESMYPPLSMSQKDEKERDAYYIKPMSCPFHVRIYNSRPRSYRELPIRWCELGSCYRFEKSGSLHGMLRTRGFTQDDAHIICTEAQFVDEINNILDFAIEINRVFGFDKLKVYLSTRDTENKETKYIGEESVWNTAERTLEDLLTVRGIDVIKDVGGAKFYGPAIDMKAVDAMNREWQGTTIQLDMNLPSRFGMKYIGSDGLEHVPVMLHRTLLGSMERFIGVLIEQYGGAFPTWLAPVQAAVLSVTSRQEEYGLRLAGILRKKDIRVETDFRAEKIGLKIRESQISKTPYMLIVGDKEAADESVSVRSRVGGDLGKMEINEFIKILETEVEAKAIQS